MKVENIRNILPRDRQYPRRNVSDITHIDIHHSASITDNYKGLATIKSFARSHIKKGWPGIGYHYIVDPTGKAYKTGYASEMRWSVGGNNSYTISIMLIGSFDKEEISDEQYNNAVELTKEVMKAYNVPTENVMGHNEYPEQATKCPGIDMDKFREDLK